MTMSAFCARVVRRIDDATEFGVADFTFERIQVVTELVAKAFELGKKILPICLELLANLITFFRGGGMLQLDKQQALLLQELVSSLIKGHDKRLYIIGNAAQIVLQITIVPILRHNYGWRRGSCLSGQHRAGANQVCHGCRQRQQDSE